MLVLGSISYVPKEGSYEQGVVMNKIKLSGVAPRKRETTNMG
jgi:hypothetical protein